MVIRPINSPVSPKVRLLQLQPSLSPFRPLNSLIPDTGPRWVIWSRVWSTPSPRSMPCSSSSSSLYSFSRCSECKSLADASRMRNLGELLTTSANPVSQSFRSECTGRLSFSNGLPFPTSSFVQMFAACFFLCLRSSVFPTMCLPSLSILLLIFSHEAVEGASSMTLQCIAAVKSEGQRSNIPNSATRPPLSSAATLTRISRNNAPRPNPDPIKFNGYCLSHQRRR